MKIAIIECDIPMPTLVEDFGNYTEYFSRLLRSSVDASTAASLSFVSFEAYLNAPLPTSLDALSDIDGIVLTGSKFTSYDNDPWILRTLDFIRLVYGHIKIAGICFGHQLLARALGGDVAANPLGWEIAVTSTTTFKCPVLPDLTTLRLQQMHRDIVTRPPPSAEVVGGNDVCAIQAMYERGKYFSVQGHPEFNQRTVELVLKNRMERGIVPREYGEEALKRAGLENDGQVVGAAIVAFFSSKDT